MWGSGRAVRSAHIKICSVDFMGVSIFGAFWGFSSQSCHVVDDMDDAVSFISFSVDTWQICGGNLRFSISMPAPGGRSPPRQYAAAFSGLFSRILVAMLYLKASTTSAFPRSIVQGGDDGQMVWQAQQCITQLCDTSTLAYSTLVSRNTLARMTRGSIVALRILRTSLSSPDQQKDVLAVRRL